MLMEGAFLTDPMSVCPMKVMPSSSAVQPACEDGAEIHQCDNWIPITTMWHCALHAKHEQEPMLQQWSYSAAAGAVPVAVMAQPLRFMTLRAVVPDCQRRWGTIQGNQHRGCDMGIKRTCTVTKPY
jgi:hypothetical protein